MHTTDQRQPKQPEYPFLDDARFKGLRDTYLALRSFGQGMAVETLARKRGVCERTVQYHLRKLKALGVLQVKTQHQDGRQKTNFYLFPTPDWWVDPGPVECHEGCQSPGEGCHRHTTKGQVSEGCNHKRPGGKGCHHKRPGQEGCNGPVEGCHRHIAKARSARGATDTPNSPLVVTTHLDVDGEEPSSVISSSESSSSKSSRVPGEPRWPYTHRHTWELVEFFKEHIGARDIREKGKARKVSAGRRGKWIETANALLDHHSLEELTAIVSWVFTDSLGQLPFPVVNPYIGRVDSRERRVTRLAQILEHYDEIVAMMDRRLEVVVDPPASKPKAFYDHGEGSVVEDQVAVLVELFRKTRQREPKEFDLFEWRKTFRIMLTHHQIPYDDIVMVLTALGDKRLRLDFARYRSPYDLVRRRGEVVGTPGEWENILAGVKIALRREQMRPHPSLSRSSYFDDDDDWFGFRSRRDDDTGGAVNMADSVADRHAATKLAQRRRCGHDHDHLGHHHHRCPS